ncbi:MAG TPA: AsmA-like C-terminal region-containing protein [Hyphomicrobiaceae bacterium]|nr:AsmA-like C-terminal region-containing protein [Hyphomicrobiaceae bacterium]
MREPTVRTTTRSTRRRRPQAVPYWRNVLQVIGKSLLFAIGVLVVAAGLFYARLWQGPVALGFLVGPLERAIAEELAGFGVEIDNVAARLNDRHQLEFELSNVRIADPSHAPLAVAPSATFSISHRALLQGRIAPESVDLISPRLVLYYGEDGKLSLQFSAPGEVGEADRQRSGSDAKALPAVTANAASDGSLGRIDLVKMLSDASARARRREYATAYLREVGLRAATLIVDHNGRKSIWRLPELDIDLDHRRSRSSIAGRAQIESLAGPWTLNFRTFEAERTGTLQLALSVQNLVPRGLARTLPHLAALEGFDLPVWGEAQLELSSDGDILGGKIGIDAAPGSVALPWLAETPFAIDGGHVEISYLSRAGRFEIAPSVLVWGDSRVEFGGSVSHDAQAAGGPAWAFELKSLGGWIGAELPTHERLAIDDWAAYGLLAPERGRAVLSQFVLRAGGAELTAEGDVTGMGSMPTARLEGRIGAMSADTFKAVWPAAFAPHARAWLGQRLTRGELQGGTFKLLSGGETEAGAKSADRVALTLVGSDLALAVSGGWPTLEVPRALARLDGHSFEISVPDGAFVAADGRRVSVKGNVTVDMQEPMPRTGHITAKANGPLSLALEMLAQEPFNALEDIGLNPATVDGKVEAQVSLAVPLTDTVVPADVKVEGRARISDGRVGQIFPPFDIHGANIAFELTDTAVEARGDMLIKNVPVKANWQHVFGVPAERQPPLTITANLDANDRNELGLDINDLVLGDIATEVTVFRDARNEQRVHLRVDLANAEISLDSIAWKKPKGRSSTFQCDVVKNAGGTYPIELVNVQLVGDNVAIEGWMGVGADHRVREYRYPNFSINVITSLQAHGKLRPDGIWEVTAKGPRYDGRDLFQSFFDVVGGFERDGKVRPGLDLRAEIDTVVGFNDSALRNVKVWLQRRNNKLTALDARGVLDGNKAFSAVVRPDSRLLRAEASDAGQLFKLVGFYNNAVGGSTTLDVNLDGSGLAQRTGTLVAKNFVLLGDAVGGDVLVQGADGAVRPIGPADKRGIVREQFAFESLRVPFSVGHGQFLLNEARIEGPVLSANMRGKIDFRTHIIHVGGTFTPLAGLNTMFRDLPLFGPLLTGPRGDGVFAMTFAIQGSMGAPQIIVNPFSVITPGVTREIMQMAPENQRIVPRDRPQGRSEVTPSRSASPPAAATSSSGFEARVQPEIGGGWSAEAEQSAPSKKK